MRPVKHGVGVCQNAAGKAWAGCPATGRVVVATGGAGEMDMAGRLVRIHPACRSTTCTGTGGASPVRSLFCVHM